MATPENAVAADEALNSPIVDSHPREEGSECSAAGVKRKSFDGESAGGEEGPANPLWKTSLRSFFRRRGGDYSHGAGWRYAQGEKELRPSERGRRLRESEVEEAAAEEVDDAKEDLVPPESPGGVMGRG